MSFVAPLWLLGLLPWSAVVLYLLWGRRRRVDVPFLDLWPGDAGGQRVRRRATPPPLALALAILATLLAVLAAGRPGVALPGRAADIRVILDRGFTMSRRGGLSETLAEARPEISRVAGAGARLTRRLVPGGEDVVGAAELGSAPANVPTALDTHDTVRVAARDALRQGDGPVIVVSDDDVGFSDARLVPIRPSASRRNVAVRSLAARETPAPQAMVRIGAIGFSGAARLRVSSGDTSSAGELTFTAGAAEQTVFIDLPRLGQTIKAEVLNVGDDQPGDDAAWLAREASWPRLEPRTPLPPHLQRMVDVYARQRPPTAGVSRGVVLVAGLRDLSAGEAGVILEPAAGGSGNDSPNPPVITEHPVTRGVTWADVGSPGVAAAGPPAGYTPVVVSQAGKVWVGVREQPIRTVWVGFDTSQWARSPAFVVFWANVFNWAGAGGERFASHPVGSLEGDGWQPVELAGSVAPPEALLWPGLYRRSDGTLRALHAPVADLTRAAAPATASSGADWSQRLARLARASRGQLDLAPWLAAAALACLAGAAAAWRRRVRLSPAPA